MRSSDSFKRKRRGSFQPTLSKQDADLLYLKESLPERYECRCNLCQAQSQKTLAKQQHFDPSQLPEKLPMDNVQRLDKENSYSFVLLNILESANMKRSLGVCVPDTVMFEGGVPQCIVISPNYNKEDYFKVIRQKQKLSYLEIRKFFDERRKKYANEAKAIRVQKTNGSYQTNNPEAPFFRLESSSLSFKDSLKSRLENYTSLRPTQSVRESQLFVAGEPMPLKQRQLCVVNFTDNTTQIMSSMEYNYLLQRRKIDPYWSTVSTIQSILKPFGSFQYKRVQFSLNRVTDEGLYERARREVKIILEDFQRDEWVSWEEQESFRNQLRLNENKYLLYLAYRMVHFLRQSSAIIIWKASFFFLKDVFSNYYFTNITNIHFSKQQKTLLTQSNNQVVQNVLQGSMRILYEGQQKQIVSKICRDLLMNAIELRKIELQLSQYNKPSQSTIDTIFGLFHPNFETKLQRTMLSVNWKRDVEELIDEVRKRTQYLINNNEGIRILHLHGIYFVKTLDDARPMIRRSLSARPSERRMSSPLFANNFRVCKKQFK